MYNDFTITKVVSQTKTAQDWFMIQTMYGVNHYNRCYRNSNFSFQMGSLHREKVIDIFYLLKTNNFNRIFDQWSGKVSTRLFYKTLESV